MIALYVSLPLNSIDTLLKKHVPFPLADLVIKGGHGQAFHIPVKFTGSLDADITRLNFIAATHLSSSFRGLNKIGGSLQCSVTSMSSPTSLKHSTISIRMSCTSTCHPMGLWVKVLFQYQHQ